MKEHNYNTDITWTGNTGEGTTNYRAYQRSYTIEAKGKPAIQGSSDPSFLGNPALYNPEELFLAAISACHMLWYLHLCAENKVTVMAYQDKAKGIMQENKNGSGSFKKVTLYPEVEILEADKIELAEMLHSRAHEMCFIANSCNFAIEHQVRIQIFKNK